MKITKTKNNINKMIFSFDELFPSVSEVKS